MQGENNKNYAESYYLNEHHHVNYFLLKFVNKERSSLVDYFRSEIWYSVITPDILNLNKVACAELNEKKHIFTQNSMINELFFKYKVFFHFHLTYNAFSCKKQVQYLLQSKCSRHNNIWRVSLMINVHHNLLSFNVNSKNFFINITFNSSLIKLILLDKENLLLVPQNRRIGVMNKFSGVNITKCTDYANIFKRHHLF